MTALHIVWFKRDLRIEDHAALAAASAAGPVLPLFIAEPGLWAEPDASARQWNFVAESLADLATALESLGQPLAILRGEAVPVLRAIAAARPIAALWSHEETGNGWTYTRDRQVAAWARQAGIPWHQLRQTGVVRGLKSRDGWSRAWEAEMTRPPAPRPRSLPGPVPDLPRRIPVAAELGLAPDPCPDRQPGGRAEGLRLLESFLKHRGRDYRFRMSSPLTATEACSRISAHLAWGTLSLREVAHATWARQRALPAASPEAQRWRASLISFEGRLRWHCHFIQKLEDEPALEFRNLHPAYDGLRPETPDPARLAAFCAGATGFPFVDACLRALDRSGWLNFRMRAMLVSFASYHLWLPWRETGLFLARRFVDYEPGIHWPQVQMQSGTTGINTMRVYNPVKQGQDQDPEGRFIRRHLPELAEVPQPFLHEPWLWPGATGLAYPPPVVDHLAAARSAREAVAALRKSGSHAALADRIADRHGSRKSGLPMTGRRPRPTPRRKPPDQGQLSLDL